MANKRKAAIIGCGSISGGHANGYQKISDRISLAYCVDLIPERAENRKAEYGDDATICLTDYKELLADKSVDIVSICLPNHLHAQVSIDCLNAGKHVLCEKPAAMNYEEALAMKEAADRNGKILNIGVVNHREIEVRIYILAEMAVKPRPVCVKGRLDVAPFADFGKHLFKKLLAALYLRRSGIIVVV